MRISSPTGLERVGGFRLAQEDLRESEHRSQFPPAPCSRPRSSCLDKRRRPFPLLSARFRRGARRQNSRAAVAFHGHLHRTCRGWRTRFRATVLPTSRDTSHSLGHTSIGCDTHRLLLWPATREHSKKIGLRRRQFLRTTGVSSGRHCGSRRRRQSGLAGASPGGRAFLHSAEY